MDNFSKKSIRSIIDSDAAYEILDNTKANGSTWCAGGCAILAYAINIAYGFPIYVIYNYDYKQIEHFGVKLPNGSYVDCDGMQYDWLRNFKRKEFYMRPKIKLGILPYDNNLNKSDIIIDINASQKLANLFKPEPNTSTNINQTLHQGLF